MSTPTAPPVTITEAQKQQFRDEGYFILYNALTQPMLQVLRDECAHFIVRKDEELDQVGTSNMLHTRKGNRYFIHGLWRESPRLWRYIFSDLMAEICRATLGNYVQLANEQWVVKCARQGLPFGWHQDSGYARFAFPGSQHQPFLSCWTTLDDVDESNGTIFLLPHSQAGTRNKILEHYKDPVTQDLIGYDGSETGIPVVAPAGSIAVFSSTTLHRSNTNSSDATRRVYLTQYTADPIRRADGELARQVVPFLVDGLNVYDPVLDGIMGS